MRKRSTRWAVLLLAIAGVVAATSTAATAKLGHSTASKTLRYSIGAEPPSLDPGLATDTTSANVLLNIMDPLVRLGPAPALKAIPSAAESITHTGSVVTVHLRKDEKWSNGAPVTSADYVWSWLRTISPELAADYAYQFFGIKGAEAYNSCDPAKANCAALRSQVGVSAPDKYTIRIQLTSPQPWFDQQLGHSSFLPVYKPSVDKYKDKFAEPGRFVSTGPFVLSAGKHDASVTLKKNTKFRNAASVKVDTVFMPIISDAATALNAWKAGNTDVDASSFNPSDIPALKKLKEFHVYTALGTYYYGFNVKNIADVNQRRAMSDIIDRKAITKYIGQLGQVPARGFTPQSITGGPTILKNSHVPAIHQTAKAQAEMQKVANPKKDIHLYINNSAGHINIATAIQAYWKQLGLSVQVKVQEWKQYLQFLGPPPNADVDVYRLGWIYDYPDAQNGLVLFTCGSGNNNTNWCNKKFDAVVDQASKTADTDKRIQLYQQAETILTGDTGDLPIMPIYWYNFTLLIKSNVQGIEENPMAQTFFDHNAKGVAVSVG